jgi:hypothetical protein
LPIQRQVNVASDYLGRSNVTLDVLANMNAPGKVLRGLKTSRRE